jgi:hypothetical protein
LEQSEQDGQISDTKPADSSEFYAFSEGGDSGSPVSVVSNQLRCWRDRASAAASSNSRDNPRFASLLRHYGCLLDGRVPPADHRARARRHAKTENKGGPSQASAERKADLTAFSTVKEGFGRSSMKQRRRENGDQHLESHFSQV